MPKGPVPRGEYVGKSSVFSTRIRPDLRQKLEQGAKKSGRSLSQEIEHRLRRSFVEDEKISDMFGDRRTFLLMKMIATALHLKEDDGSPDKWLEDPAHFEIAVATAASVLEAIRPPSDNPFSAYSVMVKARGLAFDIWN